MKTNLLNNSWLIRCASCQKEHDIFLFQPGAASSNLVHEISITCKFCQGKLGRFERLLFPIEVQKQIEMEINFQQPLYQLKSDIKVILNQNKFIA